MAVHLIGGIFLCQQHQVAVVELHGPDGLGETKTLAVPDVVHSKVDP